MTEVFFSPQYVNRVQESWEAGSGPSISTPSTGGFNPLGATLDLQFIAMDTSYETGPTLDLIPTTDRYFEWAMPAEPQGAYFIWVGYAPWEPSLNLDFVNQYYQEAS
jgi:hypothetical protein